MSSTRSIIRQAVVAAFDQYGRTTGIDDITDYVCTSLAPPPASVDALLEKAIEALRPFAALAAGADNGEYFDEAGFTLMHHHTYYGCIKLEDLRRARADLTPAQQEKRNGQG